MSLLILLSQPPPFVVDDFPERPDARPDAPTKKWWPFKDWDSWDSWASDVSLDVVVSPRDQVFQPGRRGYKPHFRITHSYGYFKAFKKNVLSMVSPITMPKFQFGFLRKPWNRLVLSKHHHRYQICVNHESSWIKFCSDCSNAFFIWLAVLTILKKVNGVGIIPYMENNPVMFETLKPPASYDRSQIREKKKTSLHACPSFASRCLCSNSAPRGSRKADPQGGLKTA